MAQGPEQVRANGVAYAGGEEGYTLLHGVDAGRKEGYTLLH